MNRILALQMIEAIGFEAVGEGAENYAVSSCSYAGCGGCSSCSDSGCSCDTNIAITM